MDGLMLMAVRHELEQKLIGGRIEKIHQPGKYELVFQIHTLCANYRLFLSAAAENGRVQLTGISRENPLNAPPLLMLLRKRLTGGRIIGFEQPGMDRVLHIRIDAVDELGESVRFTLTAEIMGRHSNLIVWNSDGTIVECVKHVTTLVSSVRQVLPGLKYAPPPGQDKRNPLTGSKEDFERAIASSVKLESALVSSFSGISPSVARAICASLFPDEVLKHAEPGLVANTLHKFFSALNEGRFQPTLVMDGVKPLAAYCFDPKHIDDSGKKRFDSLQAALDEFYGQRDLHERMAQRTASLHRVLQNALERCERKLSIQRDILLFEDGREKLRLFGELITANMHSISRGLSEITLLNYYDDTHVSVPLDPMKTPSANAQAYFKKYEKAKSACEIAIVQVEKLEEERVYLEGQLDNLTKCTNDLEAGEMREELTALGYVKRASGKKKLRKAAPSKPLHFISSDGVDIYVGKNNSQNDFLTLRFAEPGDLWLHTKEIAGSHVIVKAREVPDKTLHEAALLAAYYSKGRQSANVPVDYALRKFVKKPAGALPGKVIYVNNKTLFVTPDERVVLEMKQA